MDREINEKCAYDRVRLARSNSRPTGLDYINNVFVNFIEFHGDRFFGDDTSIVGGIGELNGRAVTVIACEKGHDINERAYRNFGAPNPEGYRKALRLMRQAEKFKRPVICFVDTSGAFCGTGAEERGQGNAISMNLMGMSSLKVPVISVIIGEGGSGGALALAVANRVWILENSVFSVISPEGCASILWKDSKRAREAAESLKLTSKDVFGYKVADRIIDEEGLGSREFFQKLRMDLDNEINGLENLTGEELAEQRYRRFRQLGV